MMRKLLIILGVPIDDLSSMDEALDRLGAFVENGRLTGKPHQIATVNADFVVKAMQDQELRHILHEADMATADGMPLVWGARLLGVPLTGRVTGADMVPALAQRAAQEGYSLYLLGAAPGVAARAGEIMQEQNPGLKITGVLSPPKADVLDMDPGIIDEVRAAKPDILLVAFGNPKQEKWIAMNAEKLGVPVMIGIGGTLDFIAGKTKRAPEWMQSSGLEWLFRLVQEPKRLWKRYVVDMVNFSIFFAQQWWLLRQGKKPNLIVPKSEMVLMENTAVFNIHGALTIENVKQFNQKAYAAMETAPNLIVNLADCSFLDSTGIGALVGLSKFVKDKNGQMYLTAVSDNIMRSLKLMRMDRLFEIFPDVPTALGMASFDDKPEENPLNQVGKWSVMPIPKQLDMAQASEFTKEGLAYLEQNPYLILDFANTHILTSSGMAGMIKLHKKAKVQGGEVRLIGCNPEIARSIQLMKLDKLFTIYPDIKQASTPTKRFLQVNAG